MADDIELLQERPASEVSIDEGGDANSLLDELHSYEKLIWSGLDALVDMTSKLNNQSAVKEKVFAAGTKEVAPNLVNLMIRGVGYLSDGLQQLQQDQIRMLESTKQARQPYESCVEGKTLILNEARPRLLQRCREHLMRIVSAYKNGYIEINEHEKPHGRKITGFYRGPGRSVKQYSDDIIAAFDSDRLATALDDRVRPLEQIKSITAQTEKSFYQQAKRIMLDMYKSIHHQHDKAIRDFESGKLRRIFNKNTNALHLLGGGQKVINDSWHSIRLLMNCTRRSVFLIDNFNELIKLNES